MKTMTRIDQIFTELTRTGKKGFVAYITAGDPTLEDTMDIVLRLEDAGVDVVELGVPFSDPLADGRVNQESATRALDAGVTPVGVLDMVTRLRARTQIPVMLYTYMNLYHAAGYAKMIRKTAASGVDGLLFLDMPVEESAELVDLMDQHKLNNIALVTPTTPEGRIKQIVRRAGGFVYCVSRTGVTGARDALAAGAAGLVTATRRYTRLPVALGFGVSTPAIAAECARAADAVVVGSAIVQKFHEAGPVASRRRQAAAWVGEMVRAVKEP